MFRHRPGGSSNMDRRVVALLLIVGVLLQLPASVAGAYNKQNPKWQAGREMETMPPRIRKGYRPLRQPPGNLPVRSHHGGGGSPVGNRRGAVGLASILVLGVAAQWLTWCFGLPATLLPVAFGFVVGPATR